MRTNARYWSAALLGRAVLYLGGWAVWFYLEEWILPWKWTSEGRNLFFVLSLALAVGLPLLVCLLLPQRRPAHYLYDLLLLDFLLVFIPVLLPFGGMRDLNAMIMVVVLILPLSMLGFLLGYFVNRGLGRVERG